MVNLDIKTNAMDASHWFDSLSRDQLPFAMSVAINKLAWDIRDQEQSDLDKHFDIRTSWLTKRGAMPVIRSDKKQAPDIHAIIGIKDEVAALAITGGKKKAKSGGSMAVPFSDAGQGESSRQILNPSKETLPKTKWPARIVKKPKARGRRKSAPFYLEASNGKTYVALRTSSSLSGLTFLYQFRKSVEIPKSWPLIENAQSFVSSNYDNYLNSAIDRAVSSMRVRLRFR